jgi:uncharacterized cupin superfamily protein
MSWRDAPIPAGDVVSGAPQARSMDLHVSREGGVSMNYWDCTAGRFHWYYASDEMVQILEGEVHLTDEHGATFTLRAGDTAHFMAGATLLWEVPEYVRKLAFHRSPQSLSDRAVCKARRLVRPLRQLASQQVHQQVVLIGVLGSDLAGLT